MQYFDGGTLLDELKQQKQAIEQAWETNREVMDDASKTSVYNAVRLGDCQQRALLALRALAGLHAEGMVHLVRWTCSWFSY